MLLRDLLSIAIVFLFSCSLPQKKSNSAYVQIEDSNLFQSEAQNRKNRLGQIDYKIDVTLNETESFFKGQVDIIFELKDKAAPLRVDFYEGAVQALNINAQDLDMSAKKKYWIEIPVATLRVGLNTLKIQYTHDYATNGQGLHRFVDPETKEVFLYSQFQTFDANRFIPCFDQPDLRATYQLQVTAPKKWSVISTTIEKSRSKLGEQRVWKFPPSDRISTYLFSLHAGPYRVWTDSFNGMPLRLFARPTVAPFVKVQEWFKITKQGLDFFNRYYKFPYPFHKYDQLVVPEFNAGAMENVGAVTFSEFVVGRSHEPTRAQRRNMASIILHEMAHMWFGDTVTMVWWNDLWLNESFATYMAQLAMTEATEFKEGWLEFFTRMKQWAYWQDRLTTSHPIEGLVPSVKDAFGTFDGITYGKGASVLKQLRAYIGESAFQRGIADYIRQHAFNNATRADFISALQKHTEKDLSLWSDRWLAQSRTDRIAAHWKCEQGQLSRLQLELKSAEDAKFRPQTIQVGLFGSENGRAKLIQSLPVTLTAPIQTVSGTWKCPALIYPNFQDDGFVAVQLDPQSLQYAQEHLNEISDDLLRSQLWWSLWEMVENSQLSLKEYIQVVNKNFSAEKNEILLRQIVKTLEKSLYYWPETPQEKKAKLEFIEHLENDFMKRFLKAQAGSDDQKLWFDSYVAVARNPQALAQLSRWMNTGQVKPGFAFDLDRQWSIVHQLVKYGTVDSIQILNKMKKKDPSEKGYKQALAAEASQPRLEVKRKFIEEIKPLKGKYSFQELNFIAWSLFPTEQKELAQPFEEDFYAYLKQHGSAEEENHVRSVAEALSPLSCMSASSQRIKNYINQAQNLSPSLRKSFNSDIDDDERCQAVRKKSF